MESYGVVEGRGGVDGSDGVDRPAGPTDGIDGDASGDGAATAVEIRHALTRAGTAVEREAAADH
jgi:hypothetical protein